MASLRVLPDDPLDSDEFELLICAIGFESRSTYIARKFRARYKSAVAFAFSERRVLNFDANFGWCNEQKFRIYDFPDNLTGKALLENALFSSDIQDSDAEVCRVLVDISSMSRPMIALIIDWLADLSSVRKLQVTFAYSPSKYVELGEQIYSMSYVGPVAPSYSGWTVDTQPRIVALVGLGGERGLALGAVEYLEATDVWAFVPEGVDGKYDDAVSAANLELLERIGPSRTITYNPLDGFGCFCAVESLAYGCKKGDRPILLPFGPKIFSAAALLVSQIYRPEVPVWRVSSEQSGEPIDREANGQTAAIKVMFG